MFRCSTVSPAPTARFALHVSTIHSPWIHLAAAALAEVCSVTAFNALLIGQVPHLMFGAPSAP